MIDILFFAKSVIDMLWQYPVLDLLLIILIALFFLVNIGRLRFTATSSFIFVIILLLTWSFIRDTGQYSTYIKVLSAFLLFLLGTMSKDPLKTIKVIAYSFTIPVVVSIIMALINKGYIVWGNNITFVGPYFYKTDLAIMVVTSTIFFRYFLFYSQKKLYRFISAFYIFAIAPYLIYLSNSRMLLIVYMLVFLFVMMEKLKYNRVKISIGVKSLFLLALSLVAAAGFHFYNKASNLGISFSSDVFSAANTQGRNGIWESITRNFFDGSYTEILFGYYFNADYVLNSYLLNDAHNSFLKILVTIGIVGLVAYLIFIMRMLYLSRKFQKISKGNDKMTFLSNTIILTLLFFIICGMTQSNIQFTQTTWYVFYLVGMLLSPVILNKEYYAKVETPIRKQTKKRTKRRFVLR